MCSCISVRSFIHKYGRSGAPKAFALRIPGLLCTGSSRMVKCNLSLLHHSVILRRRRGNVKPRLDGRGVPFFQRGHQVLVKPRIRVCTLSLCRGLRVPSNIGRGSASYLQLAFSCKTLNRCDLSRRGCLLHYGCGRRRGLGTFISRVEQRCSGFFCSRRRAKFGQSSHFFSVLYGTYLRIQRPY